MNMLPEQFSDLESWTAWVLATESQRNARRVSLPFDEISAYADAMLPRIEEICAYIDAHKAENGGYDEKTLNLFYMLLSVAEVAPAIESYDPEVIVVDGYETKRFSPLETHRLRPEI